MSAASELLPRFGGAEHLVQAVNAVRERIIRLLADYLELSARMREFEGAFAAQVLHTAQRLHEVIAERRRLEAQWQHIRSRAERGGYQSVEELENDVDAVLAAPVDAERPGPSEDVADDGTDGLDSATRDRIVREFRRIVLPHIHPDTSDTPYAVFEAAFSAYRASDFTLMEAFTIRYRGVITSGTDHDGRPLPDRLRDYRAARRRLEARHAELRASVTDDELRRPEWARERMQQQHEDFQRAIVEEAERVQDLRARLEALKDGSER